MPLYSKLAESVRFPPVVAYTTLPVVKEESVRLAATNVVPSNVRFAESTSAPPVVEYTTRVAVKPESARSATVKRVPLKVMLAESDKRPATPANGTRVAVRELSDKLAPATVPVRVGEADRTLLPVPVLVTLTTFLLASSAKAVEAVRPDRVVVPLTVRLVKVPEPPVLLNLM